MSHDLLKKVNAQIDALVKRRDEIVNSKDLTTDLALETNVSAIGRHYSSRDWRAVENTASMIVQLTRGKWTDEKTFEQSIKDHAAQRPGIDIPSVWNAPQGMMFRRGAPIVVSSASGVGKSTTARNIIVHNIIKKIPTVLVTNEDTKAETLIGLYTIYARLMTGHQFAFNDVEKWIIGNAKDSNKYASEVKMFLSFIRGISKYIHIIEAEYWSWSRVLFGIEDSENALGCPPDCVIVDYVQRIDPEPESRNKDVRLQMIEGSRMMANYIKTKKLVGILISQLNDDGKTAESRQFEKDAGQWLVIERKYEETTDTFSNEVVIRFKKGRRTGTGRAVCFVDPTNGAFIPSAIYKPSTGSIPFGDRT